MRKKGNKEGMRWACYANDRRRGEEREARKGGTEREGDKVKWPRDDPLNLPNKWSTDSLNDVSLPRRPGPGLISSGDDVRPLRSCLSRRGVAVIKFWVCRGTFFKEVEADEEEQKRWCHFPCVRLCQYMCLTAFLSPGFQDWVTSCILKMLGKVVWIP